MNPPIQSLPLIQLLRLLLRLALVLLCAAAFFSLILPVLAANPGDLDPSFGNAGVVTTTIGSNAFGYDMAIQADGKIVVAGESEKDSPFSFNFALARYKSDGSLDNSFSTDGVVTTSIGSNSSGRAVAVQPDSKIVVGGVSSGLPDTFALARYTITGSLDSTFSNDGIVTTAMGTNAVVNALAIQQDSKILAVGSILARYTITGSLDSSFGINGVITLPIESRAIAIQSDDKIVIAGRRNDGSQQTFGLVRYTITGSLDSTFGNGAVITTPIGINAAGQGVAIQPDGKIIVAGTTDANSTFAKIALARYTITGSLDSTFGGDGIITTTIGSSAFGDDVAIQNNGKIVIAGAAIYSGLTNIFALARYDNDGSLDNTFGNSGIITTPMVGDAAFLAVAVQSDDKIVGAGSSGNNIQNTFALVRYLGDKANSNPIHQTYLPVVLKQ